jgi:uncharacterized membrane protein (DUF2068 family)
MFQTAVDKNLYITEMEESMENSSMQNSRRRPLGITIIAILLGIQGVIAVLLALLSLSVVARNGLILVGVVIALIVGLVCLALAWGLWTLKRWAFGATVAVQILTIILALINFFAMLPRNTFSTTLSNIIFPVVVLIYLFVDRSARAALRA